MGGLIAAEWGGGDGAGLRASLAVLGYPGSPYAAPECRCCSKSKAKNFAKPKPGSGAGALQKAGAECGPRWAPGRVEVLWEPGWEAGVGSGRILPTQGPVPRFGAARRC